MPEDYRYNLGVGCANDDWRGVGYFSRSSVLFCLLEVGFGSGDDFIPHLKHRLGLGATRSLKGPGCEGQGNGAEEIATSGTKWYSHHA